MNTNRQAIWKPVLGCFLAPFAILAIPFIPLLNWLGWNRKTAKPDYVVEYLERFIAGTEGEWDWDDFCSVPLRDPRHDDIRERACRFGPPVPLTEQNREELRKLVEEARSLAGKAE